MNLRKTGIKAFRWGWLVWAAAPVLLWFSLRSVPFSEIWNKLRGIAPLQIALLAILNLCILLLFALRWKLILGAFGYSVRIEKILAYRLAGFGLSYFTPGPQFGGEPLQVFLLHQRDGVPSTAVVSSVFMDKMLEMQANFTFLVVGLAVAALNGLFPLDVRSPAWVGFGFLFMIPTAHLFLLWKGSRPLSALSGRLIPHLTWRMTPEIHRQVREVEDQIGTFCRHRPFTLLLLIFISAVTWVFSVVEFRWLLTSLSVSLNLAQVISLLTAVRLALLLPIPGGLGTMEAALVIAGQVVGLSPAAGLSAALIIRSRDVFLALTGLCFGGWALNAGRKPAENN